MRALAAGCTCTCRSPCRSGSTQARDLALALARAHPDDGPDTEPEPHRRADPPTRLSSPVRGTPDPARHPHRRPPARGHRQPTRGAHRPPRAAGRPNWPPSPPATSSHTDAGRRRGGGGAAAPVRGPGAGRGLPADRHHRRLRHRQVPVPVRGQAGRAGRRRLGRPHPARRAGPDRERHLARAGRLLHPVPAPRHPPQGPARRLAQSPRLRHRPAGQEPHAEPCP